MTGRGWVRVNAEFMAELLGLPKGCEIIRADMDVFGQQVRFAIEGPALPPLAEGVAPMELSLTLYQEDDRATNVRRIYGAFGHAPETKWLILERLIPPLSDADAKWINDHFDPHKRSDQR